MKNFNTSKTPDYPHWNYDRFDLDTWTDDECKTDLRFYRSDVYRQANVSNIPEQIKAPNRSTFDGIKALCVFFEALLLPMQALRSPTTIRIICSRAFYNVNLNTESYIC